MSSPDLGYIHVVASVDLEAREGKILYVNPSRVRSGNVEARIDSRVALVLRDGSGGEITRVPTEVRLEACQDEDTPKVGLIQQDVGNREELASIDLMMGDNVLDSFTPGTLAADEQVEFGLGPPTGALANRRAYEAPISARPGVSYTVQAKPDNDPLWVTLAVGKSEPKFVIDKNQFPGAKSLDVRVTESTGFTQSTVKEQKISLED